MPGDDATVRVEHRAADEPGLRCASDVGFVSDARRRTRCRHWGTQIIAELFKSKGYDGVAYRLPALAMPANKKKDPRYAGIYRDMPGYSGMGPRRLRPMIVGVPPRVGAAYAGIGRRNCGSRLLIHQMAFKPRFPGVLGSLK